MTDLLTACLLVGIGAALLLVFSVLVEYGLTPRPAVLLRRPLWAILLHVGTILLLYTVNLLIFQRPWFAAGLTLAEQLFLIAVNNAKYKSLNEPFLVQDFDYFLDVMKHPRFYLPYFGIWPTVLTTVGAIGVIWGGLSIESSLLDLIPLAQFLILSGTLFVTALLLLYVGLLHPESTEFHAKEDFLRYGQIGCFWRYGRALLKKGTICHSHSPFIEPPAAIPDSLPDIVVIQSESFFDPRRLTPNIRDELLVNYDRVNQQSALYGQLQVPAWGGNTIRTECSVLTALPPSVFGVHAFNPYRHLVRHPAPSLPGYLRALGYETICIHPYPASFYLRDRLFPKLGFEHFHDISAFAESDKVGQYIGDQAVTEKITRLLVETSSKPRFIFVMTMENHGPLHMEKPDPEVTKRYCTTPLPPGCEDLSVYLGHIANADKMIGELTQSLKETERAGLLCWYGDHLPIMPSVYRAFPVQDGATEYFIWRTNSVSAKPEQQPLSAEQLPLQILKNLTG